MVAQTLQWNMVIVVQKIAGRTKNNIRRCDTLDQNSTAANVLS